MSPYHAKDTTSLGRIYVQILRQLGAVSIFFHPGLRQSSLEISNDTVSYPHI